MTVSDAPNCSVTYDRHYDDRNSFILQAQVVLFIAKPVACALKGLMAVISPVPM